MAAKSTLRKQLGLSTEREQAEEFRRDLVIRSSARAGGQWAVGVRDTLPASETNMGRLASSLASVSGLLSQYTTYQLKKEEAEHRGKAIGSQLAVVGESIKQAQMQTQEMDERLIMQEQRTAELKTRQADAEFDNWWQRLSPYEQDQHRENQAAEVEAVNSDIKSAEASIDAAVGPEVPRRDHPLGVTRAQLRMGASLKEKYQKFFFTRVEEIGKELRDSPTPTELSAEEAQGMIRGILDEFLASKEIDPNSGQGRGLIAAASSFNAASMPKFAQMLLDETDILHDKNTQNAIRQWSPEKITVFPAPTPDLAVGRYQAAASTEETAEAFTSSLQGLDAKEIQQVERQLVSEGLTLNNLENEGEFRRALQLTDAIHNKTTQQLESITDAPWYAELQALPSAEKMKLIAGAGEGVNRFDGLIDIMGANEIDAKNFQLILDDLGENLIVDKALFEDHLEFNNLEAKAETNAQNAMAQASRNAQAGLVKAADALPRHAALVMQDKASTKALVESWAIRMLNAGRDPMSKEEFLEIIPAMAEDVEAISDENWPEFLHKASKQFTIYNDDRTKARMILMEDHQWWKNLSKPSEITAILRAHTDGPEVDNKAARLLIAGSGLTLEKWLPADQMTIGAKGLGDPGLRRLIKTYNEELDTAYEQMVEDNPGLELAAQSEQSAAMGDTLAEINNKFRADLAQYLAGEDERKVAEDAALAAEHAAADSAVKLDYELLPRRHEEEWRELRGEGLPGFWDKPLTTEQKALLMTASDEPVSGLKGSGMKPRLKTREELLIHVPKSVQALKAAVPAGREQEQAYLRMFSATEEAAGNRNTYWTEPGQPGHQWLINEADRSTGAHKDEAKTRPGAAIMAAGVEKGEKEYAKYIGEVTRRYRNSTSLSVEPEELLELIETRDVFDSPDQPFVVFDQDHFMGHPNSKYAKRDLKSIGMTQNWKDTRQSVTLPPDHFSVTQPVFKGLPVDDKSLENALDATGLSERQLDKVAETYGFEDAQSFLDSQYEKAYYKALTAGDEMRQLIAPGPSRVEPEPEPEPAPPAEPPPFTGPPAPEPEFAPAPLPPVASPLDPAAPGDPDATTGGPDIVGGTLTAEPDLAPVSPPPEVAPPDPSAPPIDPNLPPAPIEPPIPGPKVPEPPKAPAPPKAVPVPEITGTPIKWQRTGKGKTPTITAATRKNITVVNKNRSAARGTKAFDDSLNVVSTDFNDAKDAKGRQVGKGLEVVLAGNASSAQIEASKVYVKLLDQFMKNGGVKDNPIREGRGRTAARGEQIPGLWFKADVTKNKPRMMYTEPFFAAHESARKAIEKNPKEYARILIEAFGGLPGVVMIPPHTNTDPGAVTPDGKMTEQAWSKKYVIPYLQELLAERTQT